MSQNDAGRRMVSTNYSHHLLLVYTQHYGKSSFDIQLGQNMSYETPGVTTEVPKQLELGVTLS